jgi:hypothetical protein
LGETPKQLTQLRFSAALRGLTPPKRKRQLKA